jgi:hypothetical protein
MLHDLWQEMCNIVNQATELMNFLSTARLGPVDNPVSLFSVSLDTTCRDVVTQKIHLYLKEMHFLEVAVQLGTLEYR